MKPEFKITDTEQKFISSFFDEAVEGSSVSLFDEINDIGRRYTGEKHFASGGMKVITVCQDEATGRLLAKAVMKESGSDADVEQFLREARITASLQHPNILPVYDIGVDQFGRPFFTMKLIEGESLESVLAVRKAGGEISLEYLIDIFIKVNEAMAYAHSKGVIHLDLKPANIQISDYGEVLVCDWGLAKIIDEDWVDEKFEDYSLIELQNDNKTLDGFVKGTLGYLSPEQATPGAYRDQRSDIYALGALLYEILAWRKPIIGQSLNLVLKKTIEGRIKSPSSLGKQVPRSLEAVCMKALSTNPDDRYQTVSELITDIQSYTRGYATDAEEAGLKERLGHFVRRNKVAAVLCVLFTLLSMTGLYFFITGIREGEQAAKKERDKAVKALEMVEKEKEISSFYGETFRNDLLNDAVQAYKSGEYQRADSLLKYMGNYGNGLKCRLFLMEGKLKAAESMLKAVRSEEYMQLRMVLNSLKGKAYSAEKLNRLFLDLKGDPLVGKILERQISSLSFDDKYKLVREIMRARDGLHPEYNFKVSKSGEGLIIDLHGNAKVRSLQYLKFLGKIHTLDLSSTAVTNINALKNLGLQKLNINNTKVSDLTPLQELSLHDISMAGTRVKNLDPLKEMASLKVFKTGNKFPKSELKKLPKGTQVKIEGLKP